MVKPRRSPTALDRDFVTIHFLQGPRPERRLALRRVWLMLGLIALLFGVVFLRVWQEMQVVQLGYRVSRLQRESRSLQEAQRILLSSRNALASLERVENIALHELGMQVPAREQVVFLHDPAAASGRLARWFPGEGVLGRWLKTWARWWSRGTGGKEAGLGGQDR